MLNNSLRDQAFFNDRHLGALKIISTIQFLLDCQESLHSLEEHETMLANKKAKETS